ncbi:MAG: hypothetical protein HC896_05910 [Bacteroidales bacterium]|nr:hypothetical protein [Bacteroidales bacterium]
MVGALCDVMVCGEESTYFYANQHDLFPSPEEDLLFKERFGQVCATDFLYMSDALRGSQLRTKGWNCTVVPKHNVEGHALTVANNLAKKSQASLGLLKLHLARHINKHVNKLAFVNPVMPLAISNANTKSKKTTLPPTKTLQLEEHTGNILVIRINDLKKPEGFKTILADLNTVFNAVNNSLQYKVIVMVVPNALHELSKHAPDETLPDFQREVFALAIPVIAVLDAGAKGITLLMSQFCDACIYSETGSYSVDGILQYAELTRQAASIMPAKLGSHVAKDLLLAAKEYSGHDLLKSNGYLTVTKKDLVLPSALKLATLWAKLPLDTLMSWKKHTVSGIVATLSNIPAWPAAKTETENPSGRAQTTPALVSKVVSATSHPHGILVVKMEDREMRNMFSDALVEGIIEAFEHIKETPGYKVVILTGFDNYFASGGTKETLLDIQKGKFKFTDTKIFHLAMECSVPVIAAMQGHGVGAGWSLGMFADFIFFSEESKYLSPYMNYGFTPGAGATLIFPEKTGYDLAREMLLTAQEYSGSELIAMGITMPVLPRNKVLNAAMVLARQIANGSLHNLMGLKHQFTQPVINQLEENYQLELDMHEKTFVGQPETLQLIQDNFGSEQPNEYEHNAIISSPAVPNVSLPALNNPHEVKTIINKLLAQELHLSENEIDENTQFVDLGLDSITGVTWVRKINDKYNTSIEATKIYSYPTLAQFSAFVTEVASKNSTASRNINSIVPAPASKAALPSASDNLAAVKASIGKILAIELHLHEDEIDENTQFVDLGLDSITGVTWVRKINDKYSTSIEATKIYSFPTLAQFSAFVKEEAEKTGTLAKKADEAKELTTVPQVNVAPVSKNGSGFKFTANKLSSMLHNQPSRTMAGSPAMAARSPLL